MPEICPLFFRVLGFIRHNLTFSAVPIHEKTKKTAPVTELFSDKILIWYKKRAGAYSSSTFTGRPVSMDLLQARVNATDLNASL